MRRITLLLLIGVLIATGTLFAAGSQQAATDPSGRERRLVIYASHPTEMVDLYVERFKQRYGDIEVELITGGTGELLSRVQAERGRPQGDIMWGGGSHTGGSAPDLFLPFDSNALDGISPAFHDPMGFNAPFDAFTMVIVYNKNLVPENEVPRRWADLTDPKWQGRVVHANPAASSSSYAAMVTWLEIGGWELVENLARNQIIAESSSAPFTQVGQGENPIGIAYEEGAFRWVPSGNVGIVYPDDGVALLPGGLFLVRNSPNPNNAKLFAEFLLEQEQQEALARNFPGRRPTHRNVQLDPAMTQVDQLNVIEYPMDAASANRADYLARWREIMIRTR